MKDPNSRPNLQRSDYRLVLLGAGRPWRGNLPSAVQAVSAETRVLDWLLKAFKDIPAHFVGGYRFSDVAEKYPQLASSVNTSWQQTGSVASLLLAVDSYGPTVVCYTDIVIRPSVADEVLAQAGDVVMAVDSQWHERLEHRSAEDVAHMEMLYVQKGMVVPKGQSEHQAEFAGVMKLSSKAVALLEKNKAWLRETYQKAHLASLTEWFLFQKLDVRIVDVAGNWAELNTPLDLAQFLLGTKFETLSRLSGVLRHSHICEHIGVTLEKWKASPDAVLKEVGTKFKGRRVIIRSSAQGEDSWTSSLAGKYSSVADIDADDSKTLKSAIETVAAAYGDANPHNQLLIEPFLSPVKMSGVAFTRTLKYRAPYYVINYDDRSQKTDTVTSGSDSPLQTFTLLRDHAPPAGCSNELKKLLVAIQEIEVVVGHDSLDIEFAITPDDKIYILQVRPLTAMEERWRGGYEDVQARVENARAYWRDLCDAPELYGDDAIFGVMPDWNPAEIIGTRPTRLAESLYRYLVTDEVWAVQRAQYGYHDVRPQPLMRNFAGHPYIDVRTSFNSFLPAGLDNALKNKLANHYLKKLKNQPELHDKIEFDIAITCLALDFGKRAQALLASGFSKGEMDALRAALIDINQNALTRYKQDLADIHTLSGKPVLVSLDDASPEQALHWLDECKWKGVLPFAHLARSAFVAMALLKSAVAENIITAEQMNHFLASLNNVTSQLRQDAKKVHDGVLAWETFVGTYGHLRPGSYNITTPSYGDDPEYYLRPLVENAANISPQHASALPWDTFAAACRKAGFEVKPDVLEDFIRSSIEGRERAKFILMRHVNAALQIIREYGRAHGFAPEELAHLDLADIRSLAMGHHGATSRDFLAETIERNQLEYDICLGVELPALLTSDADMVAFHASNTLPNFIGSRSVSAKIAVLRDGDAHDKLSGKIVLIAQADPGWDWIFGYDIAGLITAWGGANSHMAIRAAELNIPAAIGTGENKWEYYAKADELYLNCAAREIKVVI